MPAPALVATPSATTANTYVTMAEATAYFDARLFADAWTGADVGTRTLALLAATARVDEEEFHGVRTVNTQRLKWPRLDVEDEDGLDVPANTIPRVIRDATCEVALWLLTRTTDPAAADPLAKFSALTLPGGLALTLNPAAAKPDALPVKVSRLLAPYRASGIVYVDRIG
jgi:flagellar biosynthesis regulator FlaF